MTKLKQALFLCSALVLSQFSWAEPPNLGLMRETIRAYHDTGAYQQEYDAVLARAKKYLQQYSAPKNEKLALVLDIDETVLSNYEDIKSFNFGGNSEAFHQYILAAHGKPFKSMQELYQLAKKRNIAVFFVTGRHENERSATEKNLRAAGFSSWQALYLKPADYHRKSVIPFKAGMRKKISEQGYTIIASIGDQDSDLQGGFAENVFKLPNPYYYIP